MKKLLVFLLCCLVLTACGNQTYRLEILIPAGSTEGIFLTEEEICPKGEKITVSASEAVDVMLDPVNTTLTGFLPKTVDGSVKIDAVQGQWFRIGVVVDAPANADRTVTLQIRGVTVRIP